ncbi:hypothetical protein [Rubripirellula obstinata]|nr:hypothetical protein [Rubripirellula obstinata]
MGPIPFAAAQSYDDEDMYEDDMYGDDMYSGGMYGGGRGAGGGPISIYTAPVLAIFKSMDLKPILASDIKIDVRSGPALEAEAKEVFAAGNQALACQLLYGHIAAEYEEASPALSKVKLSKLLKRPVWNLRWAISMAVRGGEDVEDPSPIAVGTSGGYSADDMEMDMGFRAPQQRNQGRRNPGRRDDDEFMDDSMDDEFMDSTPKQVDDEVPSMLSDDAAEQLDTHLGGVAAACAAEFDKRFAAGDFGSSLQAELADAEAAEAADAMDQQTNLNQRMTGRPLTEEDTPVFSKSVTELLRNAPRALPMWRPGIVFLGVGPSSEIIQTAKAEQIDLLIHFDIVLKSQGRQNQTFVQNVSRARLIHVAEGKSLIVSKAMDSSEVQQLQSSGRLSDTGRYIDDQMSALWRTVDREIKLSEMPKLSPESARRRIGSLLESGGGRNLRTLAEIRLYQSRGLIEMDEVNNAYDIIGGPDALTMMHGPREERLETARNWAIESVSIAEEE